MSFLDRFKRKPSEDTAPAKKVEAPPAGVPARPAQRGPKHEMHLELSDFLPRIAPQLLHEGPHADSTKLTFEIAELAERIAGGQTGIRLTEIYRRVPEIFRDEIPPSDETEIRFPWQKMMRMLAGARAVPDASVSSGLTAAAAEALAETFRNRRAARSGFPGTGSATSPEAPEDEPESASASSEPSADRANPGAGTGANSPLPDNDMLTHEELLRTRDVLRAQFQRARGEHERQLALFAKERQQVNEERQRFVAEMMQLKKEADDKDHQIRFEKGLVAKTADTLSKVREANAALARQVSGGRSGPERPPQEALREAAELRQRISMLESNQRNTALELGREKEAKSKLEHQLATTNGLAGESTAKIEEALEAARRDFAATQRKSGEDSARALQEAREQLAATSAAKERLAAELAEAQVRIASVSATPSVAGVADAWEGLAAAQFEADIESYRKRIKNLLAEREALTQEKTAFAEQLTAAALQREELSTAHARLTSALEATRTSSDATAAVLRAELQKVTDDGAASQKESERLRAESNAQTTATAGDRDALAQELAAARQAHETEQTAHATLRAAHEKLAGERAALAAQLAHTQAAHAQAFASLTDEAAHLSTKARAFHSELAELKAERAQATETVRATTAAHAATAAAQTAQNEKLLRERTALETQIADAERELAKLRARVQQTDVTVAGAEVAIRHHDEAIAKLREQHEQTLAARTAEHAASLTAAKAEKEEVRTARHARHEEDLRGSAETTSRLTGEIARLTEAAGSAQRDSAAAAQNLAAANAEADRKFATYQRERDGLLAERRLIAAELEAAQDALKAQSVVFARDLKRARQHRDTAAPQSDHLEATSSGGPSDDSFNVPARPQRAQMDRGENRRDVIDVAPAPEVHPPAADSGRLKIQLVRPVPIRPPQVQSR